VLWAAKNGMVGVNMTYRLAPAHPWPAGAEDVGAAARWVHLYIARHGGDPARVYLCGHSAGATHAAGFAVMPRLHEPYGTGLKGLILLSGNYDVTIAKNAGTWVQYFGEDRSKHAERSPFGGLLETPLPILLAYAELEPPSLMEQNERLEAALKQAKRDARFIRLAGHNHISIVHSINTSDTRLTDTLLEFVKRGP
jgi:triacylglycerol lipase